MKSLLAVVGLGTLVAANFGKPIDVVKGAMEGVPNPHSNVHVHTRAGGKRQIEPTSEIATSAALAAVNEYNLRNAQSNKRSFMRITDGTQQVVSGVRYDFTLQVATLACPASTPEEVSCPPLEGTDGPVTDSISASVWARPWLPEGQRFQVTLAPVEDEAEVAPENEITQEVKAPAEDDNNVEEDLPTLE